MIDIALVSMPFASPQRPSIGLGILKSALARQDISARVFHADLWWADIASLPLVATVGNLRVEAMMAEWVFSRAAFPDFEPDEDEYYKLVRLADSPTFREDIDFLRDRSAEFVDMTARALLAHGPKVIGCTSMFQQNTASLALLRRARELDPTVVTVMGGANCEEIMGQTLHRAFDWVDYVVNGEAEVIFPKLCKTLLEQGRDAHIDLPGVHAPWHRATPPKTRPRRLTIENMDVSPCPDYTDYFDTLNGVAFRDHVSPGVLVETSRGCWWGQKHHCTFCGLNGSGMNYRAKSGDEAVQNFHHLAQTHGVKDFGVVDNIIDMTHLKTVLPKLIEADSGYTLFYETKANLRREQVALLAEAGANWIQPGVESLHDDVLDLMDKGTTAMINVQLLKYARESGVRLSWNILMGFPGEQDDWYDEVAEWLPLIAHLQPPAGVGMIRFDRFSPYHNTPEKFGLRLRPLRSYSYIYPMSREQLDDMAYFFEDERHAIDLGARGQDGQQHASFRAVVQNWAISHRDGLKPMLAMTVRDDQIILLDTRSVGTPRRVVLSGLDRLIYLACADARSMPNILAALPDEDPAAVAAALDELVARKLMLRLKDRYLTLALAGDVPELPNRFPGGDITNIPEKSGSYDARFVQFASQMGVFREAAE
ncbi:RiPP maturation radical SAM C-methyltransferase [Pseudosulfitobacter sp. SM2401]|uniref:RiPP maturation radical SAM C-methyltransferase n=1 Tax=Pseudosulfitobacter sp. SM2401 TaxID=3350098 RepID=UPI0036F2BA24